MKPSLPVIILGAGGHSKVLIDALRLQSVEIIGLVDADPNKKGQRLMGVPIIGSDEEVMMYSPQKIRLVNGIGSVRVNLLRRQLFEKFKSKGYQFEKVVHPSAIIGAGITLSEGAQVMAGAIIQAGSRIGMNSIINTGSSVDHDCLIGNHAHISPGAVLSGGIVVGENAHIGTGAVVIQGVQIGDNSLVAAGAVVIRNVLNDEMVAGVPARELTTR
jgi:sugar O-acyltransferase (sialic acid O-acetyltransferase NeuD family)